MAIFAPDISVLSRGGGARSSVASAAYQSRGRMRDERQERTFDYTRVHQREVLDRDFGVSLPEAAPERFGGRAALWNEVERAERRADAQLARKIMIPLPQELSRKQCLDLAAAIIADRVRDGHVVDACLHRNVDGSNPHLHIMEPVRPTDARGFAPKSACAYLVRDSAGNDARMTAAELKLSQGWEKVYRYRSGRSTLELTKGQAAERGLDPVKDRVRKQPVQFQVRATDWDSPERAEEWRAGWAARMNEALEAAGRPERVDHRSYERRGVERAPQLHEGPRVRAVEERAEERAGERGRVYEPVTDARRANIDAARLNAERAEVEAELARLFSALRERAALEAARAPERAADAVDVQKHPERQNEAAAAATAPQAARETSREAAHVERTDGLGARIAGRLRGLGSRLAARRRAAELEGENGELRGRVGELERARDEAKGRIEALRRRAERLPELIEAAKRAAAVAKEELLSYIRESKPEVPDYFEADLKAEARRAGAVVLGPDGKREDPLLTWLTQCKHWGLDWERRAKAGVNLSPDGEVWFEMSAGEMAEAVDDALDRADIAHSTSTNASGTATFSLNVDMLAMHAGRLPDEPDQILERYRALGPLFRTLDPDDPRLMKLEVPKVSRGHVYDPPKVSSDRARKASRSRERGREQGRGRSR